VLPDQSPEDAATVACGELVDAGPYRSFEAATDALAQLEIIDERE
jgi:hypothetical protein